ncbi:MAG: NAD(P)/FAD-dependent oxidoreductase [Candidatus Omnitrophota bacterium]
MSNKYIVVVGGGPAGMMAAIRASQLKQQVTLIERNPSLGKKLLLTGKGRCNLTNLSSREQFLERFSANGQFLRDAFKCFFNQELMEFFTARDVKLKTEENRKVFPVSERAEEILSALVKELRAQGVKVLYQARAQEIILKNRSVEKIQLQDKTVISCDAVILATGGLSYAATGSTGDGLKIAEKLGHQIITPRPGLVSLKTREKYPRLLEGLALRGVRVIFGDGRKKVVSNLGDLLFTAEGLSGPLALTFSGQVADWLGDGKNVYVEIDLLPALPKEETEGRLLKEMQRNPKKTIKNLLKEIMPLRLVSVFLDSAQVALDKSVSQITQQERKKIASSLKALRLTISACAPMDAAMITRGGVAIKEINPRTMESRLIQGLYFAGELIDMDADTGGFNLQAAFSTGYLAGQSAAA